MGWQILVFYPERRVLLILDMLIIFSEYRCLKR